MQLYWEYSISTKGLPINALHNYAKIQIPNCAARFFSFLHLICVIWRNLGLILTFNPQTSKAANRKKCVVNLIDRNKLMGATVCSNITVIIPTHLTHLADKL